MKTKESIAIVVPNWNGADFLRECIDSLITQSLKSTIIVVDNGSNDSSHEILQEYDDQIVLIQNPKNYGFTGGVNPGIQYAIDHSYDAVALFNNDAVAHPEWLKNLWESLEADQSAGIVTGCLQSFDKTTIDSTGDLYTVWGLPYPRGRGLSVDQAGKNDEYIFGASGGASLYRVSMIKNIGMFDQDFFAYYEDVDISFRAQLAGWKVVYTPSAVAYHRIGATSSRMKGGFTVYHTFKNLPMVLVKNVPKSLRRTVTPRFYLAYSSFFWSAVARGEGWPAFKGQWSFIRLWSKKRKEFTQIQKLKTVTDTYIFDIMTHDLPENSQKLRALRSLWWKMKGKS